MAMEIIPAIVRYQRLEKIGANEGRNSEVFRASDPQLGGEVAVKEIPYGHPASYFQEAISMFKAGHPKNVVPIRFAGNAARHGLICIVMPLYKRGSLHKRIRNGPLPLKESIRVGLGVLTGVQQIHNAQLIHFDIKPSNILFSDTDDPMVADFGQTRPSDASGLSALPALYPEGLPPECFSGAVGSRKTDIYHTGLLMYRIVNGDPFYKIQIPPDDAEADARTVAGMLPDRGAYMPHIPNSMRRVINRSLEVEPDKRYASTDEFVSALASVCINKNWRVNCSPGGTTWECMPNGCTKTQVSLIADGSKWRVEIHTLGPKPRAARKPDWLPPSTLKQAHSHLKRVFRAMG